jgi:hypothetical protein
VSFSLSLSLSHLNAILLCTRSFFCLVRGGNPSCSNDLPGPKARHILFKLFVFSIRGKYLDHVQTAGTGQTSTVTKMELLVLYKRPSTDKSLSSPNV